MKHYQAEDYTFRVFWSPEDKSWVGVAEEFGRLSNISKDSPRDAFDGMVDLLQSALEDVYSDGDCPPMPLWSRGRSAKYVYEAVIEPVDGRFEARFPDLGIITQGDDIQDAVIMARDLLENHIVMSLREGGELPAPTFGGECLEGSYRMGIVVDCDEGLPQDETMTVAEAADILDLSFDAIESLIEEGSLVARGGGAQREIKASSVMELFNGLGRYEGGHELSALRSHRVKDVRAISGHELRVVFVDGTVKMYDVHLLAKASREFEPLDDGALFSRFEISPGGYGVLWNDGLDLSCFELWENGRELL